MNAGDAASVQCTVTKGDLPLKIRWYLNGKLMKNSEGIVITYPTKRVSSLTIDSVEAEHTGNYTCSASNPGASINFTTALHVNGI